MKYVKIILFITAFTFVIFSVNSNVYAGLLDDIFGKGNIFFTPGGGNGTVGNQDIGGTITTYIQDEFIPIIITIGNLVFFVSAAFLGVKYIWSGVNGKSAIKETLPTFVAGAMMFYLAQSIYDLVAGTYEGLFTGATSFESISGSIWTTVGIIVNILAISGIIAVGLKYMWSSPNDKADIKKSLVPVAVGLVFVYAVSGVLNLIVRSGSQLLS